LFSFISHFLTSYQLNFVSLTTPVPVPTAGNGAGVGLAVFISFTKESVIFNQDS